MNSSSSFLPLVLLSTLMLGLGIYDCIQTTSYIGGFFPEKVRSAHSHISLEHYASAAIVEFANTHRSEQKEEMEIHQLQNLIKQQIKQTLAREKPTLSTKKDLPTIQDQSLPVVEQANTPTISSHSLKKPDGPFTFDVKKLVWNKQQKIKSQELEMLPKRIAEAYYSLLSS